MFEADMLEYEFEILLYSRAKDKSSCCCDQLLGIAMSSWEKKTDQIRFNVLVCCYTDKVCYDTHQGSAYLTA